MRRFEDGLRRSRRRVLTSVVVAGTGAVAGCLSGTSSEPDYEHGATVDVDGEARTAEEMAAAEGLAEEAVHEGVSPLDGLSIEDHAFVLEADYEGSTIQGTLANDAGDRLELVEIRARVYDDAGEQLGRYLDRTGDLTDGDRWAFTVVVLEPPDEIDAYDVAALGTPA